MVPVNRNSTRSLAASALAAPVSPASLPKGFKKMNLPPLCKPETIPVGSVLSGEIVRIVPSISKRKDMADSKLIQLRHESGTEILLPMTGVIKQALGGFEGAEKLIGKTLVVVRNPDGETTKYGSPNDPPKKVYMFDVYVKTD